jgi:hypothetical protein
MNRMEERYRRVLRLLPTEYRLRWEEEMVEAFLTSVETDDPERAEFLADLGRPSLAEVVSVAALSLRLRLGLAGPPTPRSSAWGAAWRFVALAWLLAGAAVATANTISLLWTAPLMARVAAQVDADVVVETAPTTLVWQYAPLLWVVAFVALLLGRLRLARVVAVVLVARNVVTLVASIGADLLGADLLGEGPPLWLSDVPTVLVDLGLLATLWAFVPGRPVVARRTPWLLAFAAAVGLVSAHIALVVTAVLHWSVVDSVGLLTVGVVTAALVHLARRHRDPAHSLGLALLVGIVLVQRLTTLAIAAASGAVVEPVARVAEAVGIAALLLAAVPLVAVSARALARLRTDPSPAVA